MRTHALAIQCTIWADEVSTKALRDGRHGRPLSRCDAARNSVGINDGGTSFLQHLPHGAFAAANATCEANAKRKA
jgi:hypothetical protein